MPRSSGTRRSISADFSRNSLLENTKYTAGGPVAERLVSGMCLRYTPPQLLIFEETHDAQMHAWTTNRVNRHLCRRPAGLRYLDWIWRRTGFLAILLVDAN